MGNDPDGPFDATPPADAARLTRLWDAYSRRVLGYALRHVDRDQAQEVLAETFLVAWRRLADVPGDPLPWLIVVARNTIRAANRSHYRRTVLASQVARLAAISGAAVGPEEVVAERDALLRGLAALTPREREAVLLVAWDGLTAEQAAAVAGCSRTAFKGCLHRARERLQASLTDEHEPGTSPHPGTYPRPRTDAAPEALGPPGIAVSALHAGSARHPTSALRLTEELS